MSHGAKTRCYTRYLCQGAGVLKKVACWDTGKGSDANAWNQQSLRFNFDPMVGDGHIWPAEATITDTVGTQRNRTA